MSLNLDSHTKLLLLAATFLLVSAWISTFYQASNFWGPFGLCLSDYLLWSFLSAESHVLWNELMELLNEPTYLILYSCSCLLPCEIMIWTFIKIKQVRTSFSSICIFDIYCYNPSGVTSSSVSTLLSQTCTIFHTTKHGQHYSFFNKL